MNREWCKHIKGEYFEVIANAGFPNNPIIQYFPIKNINFCPICGTPRPSEPKKLADKLSIAYNSVGANHERSANVAKEWFVELIESIPNGRCGDFKYSDEFKSELLKKIESES